MVIYDISMNIYPGMTVYKNKAEKQPQIEVLRDFKDGEGARESRILLELHTGTHMDAPLHMVEGGATTDAFQVENMVVPCRVLDLTGVEDGIAACHLEGFHIKEGEFILFKTRNSFREDFDPDFIYLKQEGAEYLARLGIRGVGTDALGIERSQPDHATHKTLLGEGILILEGLRLREVPPGEYILVAAPLKIAGVEAAPVRALLMEGKISQ